MLRRLGEKGKLTVYSQDDPAFPATVAAVIDDTALESSHRAGIEIVPTVIRYRDGRESARAVGWNRAEWESLSGLRGLGPDLPDHRPGCGALNAAPERAEELALRFGDVRLASRRVALGAREDEMEACFDRGWTDGLPVVPPTDLRVYRMLQGTVRDPAEVVAAVPPHLRDCTVEKAAVNAVMAGCRPECFPVVLAALEAVCDEAFCLHGITASTDFPSPVLVVNGPVARAVGMNAGVGALGPGNRANVTIGRAVQLVLLNVGGGRPGETDLSTLGHMGKVGWCFAEDESDPAWTSLARSRGIPAGASAVTAFGGCGVQPFQDSRSRSADSLARSLALALGAVLHPKANRADALVALAPELVNVFVREGWSKERVTDTLDGHLQLPAAEMAPGAGGVAWGVEPDPGKTRIPKFRPGGLMLVRAGGPAGFFGGIFAGWSTPGPEGTDPVTKEIGR